MGQTHYETLVNLEATDQLEYRIASTLEERAAAFHLVYRSYLAAGLGEPNHFQMRVTPYHLLPTSEVFIAVYESDIVFTMTLITDGDAGLPMEYVYPDEVQSRRDRGLRLAEVSCLADRRTQFRGFFPVFLRLSRIMVQYGLRQGVDELLVAVHPKHARFYQRCMEFRPIGEERSYPTVCNNPAIALSLDFHRVERERPPQYNTFFGNPLPPEVLEPQPISPEEIEFFRMIIDPTFRPAPLGPAEVRETAAVAAIVH
ncbi:MAG: N-acyl amino acid synthase FeeM domain-containing protein [Planctomycetota bacterium]